METLVTIYKQALKVLPVAYRDRYGEPMVRTLEDMIAAQTTTAAKWNVWLRTMLDLPITTAYQYVQTGGKTMNQAPNYAKQGTMLSTVLLLPFIIVVTLNSIHPLTKSLNGLGYFSVFVLPIIALLLGLAVLGRLIAAHDLWSRLKSIKQLQNNWILLTVPILAFAMVAFAFGHDRVHCITDGHPNTIVQCIRNS
jgi:amino acid permease